MATAPSVTAHHLRRCHALGYAFRRSRPEFASSAKPSRSASTFPTCILVKWASHHGATQSVNWIRLKALRVTRETDQRSFVEAQITTAHSHSEFPSVHVSHQKSIAPSSCYGNKNRTRRAFDRIKLVKPFISTTRYVLLVGLKKSPPVHEMALEILHVKM